MRSILKLAKQKEKGSRGCHIFYHSLFQFTFPKKCPLQSLPSPLVAIPPSSVGGAAAAADVVVVEILCAAKKWTWKWLPQAGVQREGKVVYAIDPNRGYAGMACRSAGR